MSQLFTFISEKEKITLKDASIILEIEEIYLDKNFGVVEIDPEIHEYCVLTTKTYPDLSGSFKNVRIEPMNLEEE